MSVHQTYDGRWICTYKDADNKRRDKSFGRGPNAEASAKAFEKATAPSVVFPVTPATDTL